MKLFTFPIFASYEDGIGTDQQHQEQLYSVLSEIEPARYWIWHPTSQLLERLGIPFAWEVQFRRELKPVVSRLLADSLKMSLCILITPLTLWSLHSTGPSLSVSIVYKYWLLFWYAFKFFCAHIFLAILPNPIEHHVNLQMMRIQWHTQRSLYHQHTQSINLPHL